jgi:hypothetical protein
MLEKGAEEPGVYGSRRMVRLRSSAHAGDLIFSALGYADTAITSYRQFEQLQHAGVVPPHMRFQVSLPTPLAPLTTRVALHDRPPVEPAYQQRIVLLTTNWPLLLHLSICSLEPAVSWEDALARPRANVSPLSAPG